VTLWANGKLIGEVKMPHTVPVAFSSYAGMDIGRDNGLERRSSSGVGLRRAAG
jgi:hypothetical protein